VFEIHALHTSVAALQITTAAVGTSKSEDAWVGRRKGRAMTPHQYLQLAQRYRKVMETAKDSFTRHQFEGMERSYRTLSESERALRKSVWLVQALGKLRNGDNAK
jgi:hypothetical protein